jgi:hypothetical protein
MKSWTTLISNQQGIARSTGPISPVGLFSQDHLGIEHPISLLPISMKIAAKTLGTDLVAVQPLSGPSGMLNYIDFNYQVPIDHLGIEI